MKRMNFLAIVIVTMIVVSCKLGADEPKPDTEIEHVVTNDKSEGEVTLNDKAMILRSLCQRNQDLLSEFITSMKFDNNPPHYSEPLEKVMYDVPRRLEFHNATDADVQKQMKPYIEAQKIVLQETSKFRIRLKDDPKWRRHPQTENFIRQSEANEKRIVVMIHDFTD